MSLRLSGGALDTLKWLALTTMTVDHINTVLLFRQYSLMTWLGRLSFPLFAFLVAYNAVYRSRRPWRYLGRLVLFAAVSQPVYVFALYRDRLNIFATLAVGLLAILLGRDSTAGRHAGFWALVAAWIGLEELGGVKVMSFGFGGAALVAAAGAALRPGASVLWRYAVLAVLVGLNLRPSALSAAVLATVAALPLAVLVGWRDVAVPMPRARWLWYSYYPAHLLLLGLAREAAGRGVPW